MKYRDIETCTILTEDELRTEYDRLRKENETEAETFTDYLRNCLDKNGTLEKVADDVWIKRLQRKVAEEIACDEIPYDKVLEIIQKHGMFEDWTAWEINNRPVDVDAISEMVEEEYAYEV